jgi:hypothetical protein
LRQAALPLRAAKEGDLLGIDGVRVSQAEHNFIVRLGQVTRLHSG